ncbi:aspartate carbamoyltransferase domain protein [Mycobacterium xenopi 4042]|uniref:Aspartate carbamoyltransferase domain protein n=1 Tax=Mycobacterium xenopi 4042 TaxID=1299334 RepID=X7ZM76_MYCXE|nr:aspartate carbamoyltransferase domain protein [Mycobacterium xenopi 4042]
MMTPPRSSTTPTGSPRPWWAVRSRSCRRCAAHHHHDVLRELHPHPGVVRSGRQADERRRDQRQRDGIVGGQGESLRDTALTLRAAAPTRW